MWAAILAQILCPYVSRWFSVKRWFLLGQSPIMNLPQIVTALIVMYPLAFHMANSDVLLFFVIAWTVNWFTSGFFFMPFQEMIMNSLPRSVIGRLNGLSNSLGTALGIAATLGVIAYLRFHSDAFDLALMLLVGTVLFWAQIALVPFLKEKPAHTADTPVPWSKDMLRAAWENKPFMRLLGINAFMACTVGVTCMGSPVSGISGFVGIYAMKGLHMSAAQAVSLGLLTQVVAVICAGPVGFILDKFGAKRLVSTIALTGLLSNLCLIFIRNQWGVYAGVAFAGISSIVALTTVTSLFYILPKSEHRNGHFAIQWTVLYATQAIGFISIGWLLDRIPYNTAFVVAAGLYVLLFPMLKWAVAPIPDPKASQACATGEANG
jgi:MFS family permease